MCLTFFQQPSMASLAQTEDWIFFSAYHNLNRLYVSLVQIALPLLALSTPNHPFTGGTLRAYVYFFILFDYYPCLQCLESPTTHPFNWILQPCSRPALPTPSSTSHLLVLHHVSSQPLLTVLHTPSSSSLTFLAAKISLKARGRKGSIHSGKPQQP